MSNPTSLFRHRALVQVLIARDLRARYRGSLLGFVWSFANPLFLMALYVIVFSVYLRIDMDDYAGFLLSGIIAWNALAAGLTDAAGSVIANGAILKNSSLPARLFPIVSIGSHSIHLLLSLPILVALLHLVYGRGPTPALAFLPLLVALQGLLGYGLGLILSAAACRFRDVLHLVPTLMTALFFLTPILYPSSMIPEPYRVFSDWSPLARLFESYQRVLYEGVMPEPIALGVVAGASAITLLLGLLYFEWRKHEFAAEI